MQTLFPAASLCGNAFHDLQLFPTSSDFADESLRTTGRAVDLCHYWMAQPKERLRKKSYGGGTGFVLADSGIQVGTLNSKLLREERKSRTTRSGSLPAHVRRELPSMTKQEWTITSIPV